MNVLKQRGQFALVARLVTQNIPSFEKLFLPPSIEKLCHYEMGMVLLAGVTGSGKSTTIASMLDYMNQNEPLHILTIEDPDRVRLHRQDVDRQPAGSLPRRVRLAHRSQACRA